MSRKANNLRRRLRITREHAASVERGRQQATAKLSKLIQRAADEDKSFARSIMIRVEKEPMQFETYAAMLRFSPQAYLYHAMRSPSESMVCIDHVAREIGYRIGDMVTRAIMEQAAKMGMAGMRVC